MWWSLEQTTHLGAAAWKRGAMCPHSLYLPQKASGRQASSKASASQRRPKSRTPPFAEAAKSRLPYYRGHHRRGAVPVRLEAGPGLGPAQPPDLNRDAHPTVLRLKLLSELTQTTVSCPPHVPGQGVIVDTDPLSLLLGGKSLMLLSTT